MKKNDNSPIIPKCKLPYLIAAIILISLLFCVYSASMSNDEGIWNYIGWLWALRGIPPYLGAVENKTPGIFILYALSNLFFGINYLFPRIIGVLAILINSFVVYAIVLKLHNKLSSVFAMTIFGLSMSWFLMDGRFTAHTETFMALFITLAFYQIITAPDTHNISLYKRKICLSGVFMGLAISFKQIAIVSVLAIFFFYLSNRNKKKKIFRDSAYFTTGLLLTIFLSVIPLLLSRVGILDYWKGAWLILLEADSGAPFLIRLIGLMKTWVYSRIILFYPFILLFIFQRKNRGNIPFRGLIYWFLIEFLCVNASGYYHGHQLRQLVPILAIISGIAIGMLFETKTIKRIERQGVALTAGIIVVILLWLPYESLGYAASQSGKPDIYKELSGWVRENTAEDDYIYILGKNANQLQAYSERKSSSKFFNHLFINLPGAKQKVEADVNNNQPKILFIETEPKADVTDEVKKFIDNQYTYAFTKSKFVCFTRTIEN